MAQSDSSFLLEATLPPEDSGTVISDVTQRYFRGRDIFAIANTRRVPKALMDEK
jgi:hypothetical protein